MVSPKDPNLETTLARSFIFSSLPAESLAKLARLAKPKKIVKGGFVFVKGDKAQGFFLVAKGRVNILAADPNGKERTVKIIKPGETFGEAAIFQKNGYPCSALASVDSSLLFFPGGEMKELLRADGDLALSIIGLLAHKLEHLAGLIRLSLKEVAPKVAERLLAWPHRDDRLVDPPRKSALAKSLGVTPESLSRALTRLKKAGLIGESPTLVILNRDGLAKVAEGNFPGPKKARGESGGANPSKAGKNGSQRRSRP
jgi:CRP/FNR family transcriptional regulator